MTSTDKPRRCIYLYGVVPKGLPPPRPDPSLQLVAFNGLVAVVELVPEPDLRPVTSPEALDVAGRRESVAWVAEQARRHREVLNAAMSRGPIVPARLCTLFEDAGELRRTLAARERSFMGAFDRWNIQQSIDQLGVHIENIQASESDIRDLDFAAETANFTRSQILFPAGTAGRAQANLIPPSVLQLPQ